MSERDDEAAPAATGPTAAACEPREDGALAGRGATTLALAGPRLLAHASGGGVRDVFVWGGGRIGGVRLQRPAPRDAQAVVEPGRLSFTWAGGAASVTALQELPAIELRLRGADLALAPHDVRMRPDGLTDGPGPRRRRDEAGWRVDAPWATLRLWAPGSVWSDGALRLPVGDARAWIVAGQDPDEVDPVLATLRDDPDAPGRRHDAWIAELRDRFEVDDPLLRSLFVHGVANAQMARKELAGGAFATPCTKRLRKSGSSTSSRSRSSAIQASWRRPGASGSSRKVASTGSTSSGSCPATIHARASPAGRRSAPSDQTLPGAQRRRVAQGASTRHPASSRRRLGTGPSVRPAGRVRTS